MSDTVHALIASADGIGMTSADRLVERGIETVGDLAAADRETLTAVPYVSHLRANRLQELAAEHHDAEAADEQEKSPSARETVLDASVGDRLQVDLEGRDGWTSVRYVIDVEDPETWRDAAGVEWETRRVRIADSATWDGRTEWELVIGAQVYVTGGPAGDERWPAAHVDHVGRVQDSTYVRLQAQQQDTSPDTPDGDDSWRRYQRGDL